MPTSKDIKADNVTPLREEIASVPATRRTASFDFGNDADVPHMVLGNAPKQAILASTVIAGTNLSGRPKIVIVMGRGKTGKTFFVRLIAERAALNDTPLLMADCDPTNDTFSRYFEGVGRPSDPADPAVSITWLEKGLQHALSRRFSMLGDLGGGNTTFQRLVAQIPDLVKMFEDAGFAVVAIYTVGPQQEDLSPLATMQGLGFKPTATAIILNEGFGEIGKSRDEAFARITGHPAFKQAILADARIVYLPRLLAAEQIEARVLSFHGAADGETGKGTTALGPFDRSRVRAWLQQVETNLAPIATWLP